MLSMVLVIRLSPGLYQLFPKPPQTLISRRFTLSVADGQFKRATAVSDRDVFLMRGLRHHLLPLYTLSLFPQSSLSLLFSPQVFK